MSRNKEETLLEEDEEVFETEEETKSAPKKKRPNMDEDDLPVDVTAAECRKRYNWLNKQLPVSARVNVPGLTEIVGTVNESSPNMRRQIFELGGEEYYDMTSFVRAVYEKASKPFNPKSIKAWEIVQWEVKDEGSKDLVWSPAINVVPSEYRGPKAKNQPAPTKKATTKKSKNVESKSDSKKSTTKKTSKKTTASNSSKKSPPAKTTKKSSKRKAEVEEEEVVKPKKKSSSPKKQKTENKLVAAKVIAHHNKMEDTVEVHSHDNQTALEVVMKYNLQRAVMAMDIEEIAYLTKKANSVLNNRGRKALSIPTEAQVASASLASGILPSEQATIEEDQASNEDQALVEEPVLEFQADDSIIHETVQDEEANEDPAEEEASNEDPALNEEEQNIDEATTCKQMDTEEAEQSEFVESTTLEKEPITEEPTEDQAFEVSQDEFVSS